MAHFTSASAAGPTCRAEDVAAGRIVDQPGAAGVAGPAVVNVRGAWFGMAIAIYRGHEQVLSRTNARAEEKARSMRRLKAALPAMHRMLRDGSLVDEDRVYLVDLLRRLERLSSFTL